MERYSNGQKWCKRCGEYRNPDEMYKGKIGYFCNECGGRLRSAPRHSDDRQKFVENLARF